MNETGRKRAVQLRPSEKVYDAAAEYGRIPPELRAGMLFRLARSKQLRKKPKRGTKIGKGPDGDHDDDESLQHDGDLRQPLKKEDQADRQDDTH